MAVESTATLVGNEISGNKAESHGGLFGRDITLINNLIRNNIGYFNSGGVGIGGNSKLIGNTIIGNSTTTQLSGGAGGLHIMSGDNIIVSDNVIISNTATAYGGGIYMQNTNVDMTNNVIIGNHADLGGDGIFIANSNCTIQHSTIRNNSYQGILIGNGQTWTGPSTVAITNTIISSHTAGIVAESDNNPVSVNGVLWYENELNTSGDGQFIIYNEHTGNPNFLPDGYHINEGSQAIDLGEPSGISSDIDGEPRPMLTGYDLGADEFPSSPEAFFLSSNPDWIGQTTVFTNTTFPYEQTYYFWDFGDGYTSTIINPAHIYSLPGVFTVALTATNIEGSDQFTDRVIVYSSPAISFDANPIQGVLPLTVTFTSIASTIPSGDPTLTYLWDFGDGLTSTIPNPIHTYDQSGIFTVTLTVSNAAGSPALIKSNYIHVDAILEFNIHLPILFR